MKISTKLFLAVFLVSLLLLASCKTIYVCYDGSRQEDAADCPKVPYPVVTVKDAEKAIDKYGLAYSLAKGDRFTRVNVYAKDGDWYSDVKFADSKNEEVHSVTLKIDGKTSSITCVLGCDYVSSEQKIE